MEAITLLEDGVEEIKTGLGSTMVKEPGFAIHFSNTVSYRVRSILSKKGRGSVIFMLKLEAATVAAEAKLPIEPFPIRFLKFLFWLESHTSPSPTEFSV